MMPDPDHALAADDHERAYSAAHDLEISAGSIARRLLTALVAGDALQNGGDA